jgi:hypothetical protein
MRKLSKLPLIIVQETPRQKDIPPIKKKKENEGPNGHLEPAHSRVPGRHEFE